MAAGEKVGQALRKRAKAELVEEILRLREQLDAAKGADPADPAKADPSSAFKGGGYPLNLSETEIVAKGIEFNSHDFLRLVIESAPQFIYWKGRDHRYLGCNLNFAIAAGYPATDDIVGKTDRDLAWASAETAYYLETDRQVMAGKGPLIHDIRPFLSADGTSRFIDSNKAPLLGTDGSVIGVIGYFDDITELKAREQEIIRHRDQLEQLVAERTSEIKQEIEARKAVEKALRISENTLRVALDGMAGGFFMVDRDLKLLAYNQRFPELYQFPDSIIYPGADLREAFRIRARRGDLGSGDVEELVARRARSYFDQGSVVYHDMIPGGRTIEVHRSKTDEGTIIAVFHDITARKISEKALADSEAYLQSVLATTQHGYWRIDENKCTLEVNEALCSMLGYPREEIIGRTPMDFAPAGNESGFQDKIDQREKLDRRTYPMDLVRGDGERIHAVFHATTLRGKDRRVQGSFAFVSDVTDLHRHEQQMRASEKRLLMILNASPIAVGITVPETGEIQYANRRCAELFGYDSPDEVLGKSARDHWCDPEKREEFRDLFRRDGRVALREMRLRNRQGQEFWAQTSWDPIRHEGRDCVLFWAYDITGLKEAEENLQQLNMDLKAEAEERRHAQIALQDTMAHLEERVRTRTEELETEMQRAEYANRTKTEFLNNMSHELRTPLNAVIGFSDMMRKEYLGPLGNPNYRGYACDIFESGSYLLSIINDILDVSRIEAGTIELEESRCVFQDIVAACLEMVREKGKEKHLRFETDIAEGLPGIWGDSRRLKQIVINLLSNALKFTPHGGIITISAALAGGKGHPDILRVAVSDTGIGIGADDLETVLEPFNQLESSLVRKHEGIGLGLPIVKSLVEQHGGSLDIESELGRGTTVSFHLPAERLMPDTSAAD